MRLMSSGVVVAALMLPATPPAESLPPADVCVNGCL
jgi:hypothetical protein